MDQPSPKPRTRRKTIVLALLALFLLPIAARAALYAYEGGPHSWREADWSSTGSLPAASASPQARVLVMTGRTGGWKGVVALHSWVVFKREGARDWTRYDVVGWGNPVRRNGWAPDGRWYGNQPTVLADISGAEAAALIPKIEQAVKSYQYANAGDYRIWPGPNSNTFVATVLRAVPELGVTMPPNAVGRDFRPAALCGPDRQRHRRRGEPVGPARRQARLGRGHRGECARPRRGARPAPSGAEAAGLRADRL